MGTNEPTDQAAQIATLVRNCVSGEVPMPSTEAARKLTELREAAWKSSEGWQRSSLALVSATPALEALVRAVEGPGPNVPGCSCDRDDPDSDLCLFHQDRLDKLRRETLVSMIVDYEASIVAESAALAELDRVLA